MSRPSLHERRWGAEEHDFAAAWRSQPGSGDTTLISNIATPFERSARLPERLPWKCSLIARLAARGGAAAVYVLPLLDLLEACRTLALLRIRFPWPLVGVKRRRGRQQGLHPPLGCLRCDEFTSAPTKELRVHEVVVLEEDLSQRRSETIRPRTSSIFSGVVVNSVVSMSSNRLPMAASPINWTRIVNKIILDMINPFELRKVMSDVGCLRVSQSRA